MPTLSLLFSVRFFRTFSSLPLLLFFSFPSIFLYSSGGNKCDLEDERQVTTAEAQDLAKRWVVPFYETSALARINVEESFFDLVREIRKSSPGPGGATGKKKAGRGGARRGGCNLL